MTYELSLLDGQFTWTPNSTDMVNIYIIVSDGKAETSTTFQIKICRCENDGECDFETEAEGQDINENGFAVSPSLVFSLSHLYHIPLCTKFLYHICITSRCARNLTCNVVSKGKCYAPIMNGT